MINRRQFFGKAAGMVAAVKSLSGMTASQAAPKSAASPRTTAPSDKVTLGIIGPGSRGQALMRAFLRVPGVRFGALCDVYEPRFAQARKITREDTPIVRDYRKLVETPGLDAIIVSTPLSFHTDHVTAAVESGHHVYGEKSMAIDVDGCNRILEAVKRGGKYFQIGHQYHYAPWYEEALRRIRAGKIGKVMQIYAYWHRNNNWRRPVPNPNDKQVERLINWRLYRQYSGGLLAELGSHHFHFATQVFGELPETVMGTGGIDYWKDGRETNDDTQTIFRYADGRTLFFSALTTNRMEGAQIKVFGTGGTVVVTEADAASYYEPATPTSAVPEGLVVEHGLVTTASFRAETPYRGPGEPIKVPEGLAGNPDFLACQSFIDCIRNHRRPSADEQSGWNSAVMVALGNQAVDTKAPIRFADHLPKQSG
jgi:predicted dehydrogenase